MAQVTGYAKNDDHFHAKKNEVLGVTEVKTFAIRYTDGEGKEGQALMLMYGKLQDGSPGVFVMANSEQLQKTLTLPPEGIRRQFLEHLGLLGGKDLATPPAVIPSDLG